jgi:hypothetical protein
MIAPLHPEVITGAVDAAQSQLALASEGVQRYVWQGAFGPMLIEVHDGTVFVNGMRVEPIAETLERIGSDIEQAPR